MKYFVRGIRWIRDLQNQFSQYMKLSATGMHKLQMFNLKREYKNTLTI